MSQLEDIEFSETSKLVEDDIEDLATTDPEDSTDSFAGGTDDLDDSDAQVPVAPALPDPKSFNANPNVGA